MTYSFESQRLNLDGVVNARDLGGYILPDGRKIRKGLLLRGASLCNIGEAEVSLLGDAYGLAVDFDFRSRVEVASAPDRLPEGTEYMWLPAIDPETEKVTSSNFPEEAYSDLPGFLVSNAKNTMLQYLAEHLYSEMVVNEYTQLQFAAFLQTIVSTTSGAVYWHCTQGKDRTGLGSAYLLAALGADRELIMADYSISGEVYRPLYERYSTLVQTEAEKRVLRTFLSANEEYFADALDLIDRRFGSMDAYLRGPLCLTDTDMAVLRERYLE